MLLPSDVIDAMEKEELQWEPSGECNSHACVGLSEMNVEICQLLL